jgi:hypothetical protein
MALSKVTYSRTNPLGPYESERVEYSVEFDPADGTGVNKDMVFTEVKETVMGWIETKEQKVSVTPNTKPSAPAFDSTSTAYWCDEHDRDFFKTKNMRGYAHPLESGGWHNMD